MKREDMLKAAEAVVNTRGESYGTPAENFSRIANLWSMILNQNITVRDVGLMMIAKDISPARNPDHEDSWIDLAGYAAITAEAIADISGNLHPPEDQQSIDSKILGNR